MPKTGFILPFLLVNDSHRFRDTTYLPFAAEHPCDTGSAFPTLAAYDIVRPRANSQMREFISLTSSVTSDACNFTASVVTASVNPGDDPYSIILSVTYKMPAA